MIHRTYKRFIAKELDAHFREVAGSTLIAFLLKAIGAFLAFGFNVALARTLGADGSGVYFLAFSVGIVASVIGRLGLDNSLLRFVAMHATKNEWHQVNGVYLLAIRLVIVAAGTMTIVVLISAPWLAINVFDKPALSEPMRWMSLGILPLALLNIHAECLKGIKSVQAAMSVQNVGVPLGSLLLLFPLSSLMDISGAVLAYVLATTSTALIGFLAWRHKAPRLTGPAYSFPIKTLWDSSKHLLIASLMNRALMPWAPIMLLGIWADSKDVGIFGAATRLALLMSIMLVALNNIVAPKFAELYAKNDIEALGKFAQRMAMFITVLAGPVFLFLIFKSEMVMGLFGAEFAEGSNVLRILVVGQFMNLLCGSVGYLLMMTGNESTYRKITISSASVQLLLILVLAPSMGIVGAALASAVALIWMNLSAIYAVKRKLGFVTVPLFRLGDRN